MKRTILALSILTLSLPAMAQTIYKCPPAIPGNPPIIQQMPCTPTGGGETMTVRPIPSGAGSGLSEGAKEFSRGLNENWARQAEIDKAEHDRREALAAEHRKAAAQEETAAAQRATARAILYSGRRW